MTHRAAVPEQDSSVEDVQSKAPETTAPTPSLFTADEIYRSLGRRTYVKRVFAFDSVDSTNSYAKRIIDSLDRHATLIVAERQTDGRGRFNRRWESEPGKNLTFSLVVKTRIPPDRFSILPVSAAELVARGVQETARVTVETKWPNDLLIDGKKFCGILLEAVTKQHAHYLVVGVGVNVNQQTFPEEFNATSLSLECGRTVDRRTLLHHIVNKLQWLIHVSPDAEVEAMLRKWKERCTMFGKTIVVESGKGTLTGLAKTLAPDGALIVKIGDSDQKLYAGDVSMVK
jgi:BirA family biotin operon repressor/biotin-[acetyl-CoA-carboxylase] ligase